MSPTQFCALFGLNLLFCTWGKRKHSNNGHRNLRLNRVSLQFNPIRSKFNLLPLVYLYLSYHARLLLPCTPPWHTNHPAIHAPPAMHAPSCHAHSSPCIPLFTMHAPLCHACPPLPHMPPGQSDRRLWKHYLSATTVADGKNFINSKKFLPPPVIQTEENSCPFPGSDVVFSVPPQYSDLTYKLAGDDRPNPRDISNILLQGPQRTAFVHQQDRSVCLFW